MDYIKVDKPEQASGFKRSELREHTPHYKGSNHIRQRGLEVTTGHKHPLVSTLHSCG